jgi:hypothetical protein
MWFRRRRKQPSLDLASLERSLDRLMELVEQILALIPELVAAREGSSRPREVEAAPAPSPAPAPNPGPETATAGFVLFAGGPSGYRLLERDGSAPARGSELELEGEHYVVLRLGPSPLPGDRRRCAFLERQEPLRTERSPEREEMAG